MTLTRLLIVLCAGLLLADHKFGDDRVVRSIAAQATDTAYRLNDSISHILHKFSSS
jgi:hypothetical protein